MVAAIEANYLDVFKRIGSLPAANVNDTTQMTWIEIPEVPYPLFNGVMRSHLDGASTDPEIERVTRHFQGHKLPALWWVWPSSRPDNLADRLIAHGWQPAGGTPGMAANLQQLPEESRPIENFVIVRVADDNLLQQWQRLITIGFELPKGPADLFYDLYIRTGFDESAVWQNYLGLLDGQPVACASLMPGAGVVGIYNVVTLPETRGKGIGTAITHHALMQAKAKGYRVAILGSSEMGYRVYQRLGFKEYFKVTQYLYSPTE